MNGIKGKVIAGTIWALVGLVCAEGADLYTITQRIGGGRIWTARAVNDFGEAVGAGVGTGYYATGTAVAESVPGLTAAGALGVASINNNHVMAGTSLTDVPSIRHAFSLDRRTAVVRDLGSLLGTNGNSGAWAINDGGLIVGESQATNGSHGVRFELDGSITDLKALGGDRSYAADVNENGDIVGNSINAAGGSRAFAIRRNTMVDLGTLGGAEARANAINNKGQIVGAAMRANGNWEACLWADGELIGLGQLGGGYSEALAINDQGVIVGRAWDAATVLHAWVRYPNGALQDLAEMVTLPSEDSFLAATAINNSGLIVASVFHRRDRGGAEYPAFLRPGVVAGSIAEGQFKISIAAPLGMLAEVESSEDFKVWTSEFSSPTQSGGLLHAEPVENGSRFYRVTVTPQ